MKIKYIALCLLLALVGCQRDEEMEIGQVSVSNERLEASYSSVEISCTFQTNVTIKNVKAYLSTTADFSSATFYSLTEKAKNTFGANIEGLENVCTYYVRYEISNRWSAKMVEKESEFNTIPYTTPTVQTNEVTDVTDEFTFGYNGATLTATFGGSALSYDAQYIINWPEFYSVNGNKFEAGSSFYRVKTVAYELGSYTVDQATDSASISMKGNVPANLKDNVIVAAVYDVTDGVKTLKNVAIATYNAENGEIKAEITAEAGQTVTFMYLDSTASVKPLAEDVSYTK